MPQRQRSEEAGRAAPDGSGRSTSDQDENRHRREMMVRMRRPWLWTNFLNIGLGLWLMTSPFTFGYLDAGQIADGVVRVTEERDLAPIAARALATTWSDLISGLLIVLLSGLALAPNPRADFFGRWGTALVGAWLGIAPLALWAPSPSAYLSDTIIGALVIAFSILVPMMPGMAHHMVMGKPGPEVPPGWSYNPSSWQQRAPIIALGLIGWLASRYLAAYQLGYTDGAWDPFFGNGSERVLDSNVSRAWPISDAGLGAYAYSFEVLMGFMGGTSRWRTMPWMVTFFGILVVPLGIVSITLVILQPVAVGAWCTLCLVTAVAMLLMIPLTVDEVVAMAQFLRRSVRAGGSLWQAFWIGGSLEGLAGEDERIPPYGAPAWRHAVSGAWGVTAPWTLVATSALGVWLMAAPTLLGSASPAADSSVLAGALVTTFAVIAMAEVTRALRFVNLPAGIWIAAAPALLAGATAGSAWNSLVVGLAVVLLGLPRGPVRESYGNWDRLVR
jgi:uncharacterized membrane protein